MEGMKHLIEFLGGATSGNFQLDGKTVGDDGDTSAFGSGSWVSKFSSDLSAGRGGGGRTAQGGGRTQGAGGGAVVLYLT